MSSCFLSCSFSGLVSSIQLGENHEEFKVKFISSLPLKLNEIIEQRHAAAVFVHKILNQIKIKTMKNLLIILAIILPIALTAQSKTPTETTPSKKNAITASIGTTGGLALDYRRDLKKNRDLIIGFNSSYDGTSKLNLGFRKYYNTDKKLSFGLGFDAGLKKRTIIGDNLFTKAIENTFLKVNHADLRVVTGAYYKLGDKFDLMGEVQLRPLALFNRSKNFKIGLKYKFYKIYQYYSTFICNSDYFFKCCFCNFFGRITDVGCN